MIGRLGAKLNLALILGVARARSRLFRWLGIWPLTAVLFAGCAPSLATASAQSAMGVGSSDQTDQRCRRLSNTEDALRYVSVGAAALGGTAGLTTIPIDDDTADAALVSTAAGFAVVGVTSEALRAQAAANYIRDCE